MTSLVLLLAGRAEVSMVDVLEALKEMVAQPKVYLLTTGSLLGCSQCIALGCCQPLYNPSTADMIVEAQRRPHTDAALDDGFGTTSPRAHKPLRVVQHYTLTLATKTNVTAIPAFPVEHKRELYGATIASAANEETGRPPHVPMHLPPFPDKHTYRSTKVPHKRLRRWAHGLLVVLTMDTRRLDSPPPAPCSTSCHRPPCE